MKVRDALTEKEEDEMILCECGEPAVNDGPLCDTCTSYWEEVDKGLWDDPVEYETNKGGGE